MADNPLNPIYCIHCKKQIPSDSVFCNFCGKSQTPEAVGAGAPEGTPTAPSAPDEIVTVAMPASVASALNSPAVKAALSQTGPNQPVVIIEQKNNHLPLILTLIALFIPVGCILIMGGDEFLAFLETTLVFWPSALGMAVGFCLWKFPRQVPEDKRRQYALVSIAVGFAVNLILFAYNSGVRAGRDIGRGKRSRAGMLSFLPSLTPTLTGPALFGAPAPGGASQSAQIPVSSPRPGVGDDAERNEFLRQGDTRDVVRMEKERVAREQAIRDNALFAKLQALSDATRLADALANEKNFNTDGTPKITLRNDQR